MNRPILCLAVRMRSVNLCYKSHSQGELPVEKIPLLQQPDLFSNGCVVLEGLEIMQISLVGFA